MGANFESVEFEGTKDEIIKKYRTLVEEQRYEHGNGGYSGTFATLAGIVVQGQVFPNRKEALDHIENTHQKRDPAIAVQFRDIEKTVEKSPTFIGKPVAASAEWAPRSEASPVDILYYYPPVKGSLTAEERERPYCYRTKTVAKTYSGGTFDGTQHSPIKSVTILADQLKPEEREKVKAAWDLYCAASDAWKELDRKMELLVGRLKNMEDDFTTEDWKELKITRKSLKKALALREKTKSKFIALDKRIGERLYKYGEKDKGVKWLVGGWCAS